MCIRDRYCELIMKQSSGHRYNVRSPLRYGTKRNHLQLQFAAHKLLGEWVQVLTGAVTARIIHLGVQAITVSLRNRKVGRRGQQNACVWQAWPSLNINVFWFLQKVKFGEKLFQTKLLLRLSLMACRLLYSPVLLLKFTSYDWSTVCKGSKQ